MTQVPPPPKKTPAKGEPPKRGETGHVVGNATDKAAGGKHKRETVNVRASQAFHKDIKQFCLDHDMSIQKLATEAMFEYMTKRGFNPTARE